MNFFRKGEQETQNSTTIQKQDVFLGAVLEVLREMGERIDRLYLKLIDLEKRIDEKIPEKVLSEKIFREEIIDIDDIAKRVASEVKSIARPIIASKEQLSIVESKRIQTIFSILQDNGKLSSSQLAKILGLSRTRANEYLKKMEELGIAKGATIGKKMYYDLKD